MRSLERYRRPFDLDSSPAMEPGHHKNGRAQPMPVAAAHIPSRTANSTPVSSPGLFSPTPSRLNMLMHQGHTMSEGTSPLPANSSDFFLHPLQIRKVRETYTANVDRDGTTGRKLINQYEVMEEIGRGQHGKVKLARNTTTGENVAIKIIPRYSKKRRLGKVTAEDPGRNTKREVAILKKIRHPNVVALLEVIDDPELKKIYMVLEYVEHGEITWRKKGLPHICNLERRLVERGARGEPPSAEEEYLLRQMERRQAMKGFQRAKAAQANSSHDQAAYEDYEGEQTRSDEHRCAYPSLPCPRVASPPPSRTASAMSLTNLPVSQPSDFDMTPRAGDMEEQHLSSLRHTSSSYDLNGTMYGVYGGRGNGTSCSRTRSPSMADSIISHLSSADMEESSPHDPYVDDYSYVPCFTLENARSAFRDTVLGLEYLHYNGVVHRDIKPANLLWTKDFRVKISDFGVSYFGRPVREGDVDETVSEAEALNFDDDRELSKTVGTPAFFAPELCYTDLDKEPPKVSEQIDVWSLGVTLYCIVFARIPFLAQDEFAMFKKIATEDVYIPRQRLRPVTPFTDPSKVSFQKRVNIEPYRDDEDAAYEKIDDDLYDLLRRMLVRNPEERIRLGEVKVHPWVTRDIPNLENWLKDTDPSRKMSGRQIEVDEKEIGRAVVPLTFLERAKSAVKKAVGKVIHPRGDRPEHSRRRAQSSAASSVGENGSIASSAYPADIPKKSVKSDDYFATVTQMPSEHPLAQSLTASPRDSPLGRSPSGSAPVSGKPSRHTGEFNSIAHDMAEKPMPTAPTPSHHVRKHGHARSMGANPYLCLTPTLQQSYTVPSSPLPREMMEERSRLYNRKSREPNMQSDDSSRALSMDRAGLVFPQTDKRAEAKVALSHAVAPGSLQQPARSPRHIRSIDVMGSSPYVSPGFVPSLLSQLGQPMSDSNIQAKSLSEDRFATVYRVESGVPKAPQYERQPLTIQTSVDVSRTSQPSPDDSQPLPPSREQTISTVVSSSVTSLGGVCTPMTSPSIVASPVCQTTTANTRDTPESMPVFQSDPSLPALMSGASSVSADVEGDFLKKPGVVDRSSFIATTDSLTPPAPGKALEDFPLDQPELDHAEIIPVQLSPAFSSHGVRRHAPAPTSTRSSYLSNNDMDDDSDSDDGMLMIRTKKKSAPRSPPATQQPYSPTGSLALTARRRDTNTSIASTETARRVSQHN
ncbi:serine/threonine-protein kinase ssp1 [Pyricularia oryzae]|nr:serine/threonine-protein kinase ssp1 [Pyricularia oryzae]